MGAAPVAGRVRGTVAFGPGAEGASAASALAASAPTASAAATGVDWRYRGESANDPVSGELVGVLATLPARMEATASTDGRGVEGSAMNVVSTHTPHTLNTLRTHERGHPQWTSGRCTPTQPVATRALAQQSRLLRENKATAELPRTTAESGWACSG